MTHKNIVITETETIQIKLNSLRNAANAFVLQAIQCIICYAVFFRKNSEISNNWHPVKM